MATISAATYDQVDTLVQMGKEMQQEAPEFRSLTFNEQKTRDYIARCIHGVKNLALVAIESDEIVGFMFAHCGDFYFANETFAEDSALYVIPERRGSRVAMQLIAEYGKWADRLGALRCYIATNTGIKTEKALNLFKRCGFDPLGYTLVKET